MKPLLVGEANPYQRTAALAERFAFHPDPPHASGGRLCHIILGLTERDYLRFFDRTDLCWPKWSMPIARSRAQEIVEQRSHRDIIIVFGAKVASAFSLEGSPFSLHAYPHVKMPDSPTIVWLPHPSGLNRSWQVPGAIDRARRMLHELGGVPCAAPASEAA